jgi:NADH:ubiquinone oxidoreductase subunit 4 (subunit M)
MTLGNLVAIQQRNIKRLLAYSSIGQAGYVLVGVAAFTRSPDIAEQASRGVVLHLTGYVFTNLAAFGAVIAFQNLNGGRERIADMAGFARRAPFAALVMMSALFSLAGMPLFAGFVTKFYLFAAAARAGLLWLVAIAVINSTISLYYYLLVLYEMYVRTPPGFEVSTNGHGVAAHGAPALALAAAPAAAMSSGGGTVALASGGGGQHAAVTTNGHASDGLAAGHDGRAGGGHDGHDGHGGGHGSGGDGGPSVPWWKRDITADVPHERFFPAYRVSWVTNFGLLLFAIGIFFIGLYPAPLIDALQSVSSALFGG